MLSRSNLKAAIPSSSWIAGGIAITLALGVKAFYSRAGADELLWVLAPSAWLARFLGGIDLVYEQGAGFISHAHHMVVGPACAGVNFLVICFLCLYFSFATRFPNKAGWLLTALLISFAGTIAANSLRIFVSAHLWNADFYRDWLSQEAMHRLAGIAIYYASLLALYAAVESRIGARAHRMSEANASPIGRSHQKMAPLLWYVGISVGVPLAGRMIGGGTPGFTRHAAWVLLVATLLTAVRNRIHCRT